MRIVLDLAMVVLVIGMVCIAERIIYEQACRSGINWQCYGVKR